MNTLKCGIKDCPSVFQTEEPIHPNARYVCSLHNKAEQTVFFQKHQFDRGLKQGKSPMGTGHVHNQGSHCPVPIPSLDEDE